MIIHHHILDAHTCIVLLHEGPQKEACEIFLFLYKTIYTASNIEYSYYTFAALSQEYITRVWDKIIVSTAETN